MFKNGLKTDYQFPQKYPSFPLLSNNAPNRDVSAKIVQMAAPTDLLKKSLYKILLVLSVFTLLYLGKALLVPLVVAALLALILNPLHQWALDRGWNYTAATSMAMFVLLLFFAGLFVAVGTQGARFIEDLPQIKERVMNKYYDLKGDVLSIGGNSSQEGEKKVSDDKNQSTDIITSSRAMDAMTKTLGILGTFALMLVYVVLLLSQKERLREFVLRRAPDEQRGLTHQTLNESRDVAQKYLRGRLILIAILTVLYSIGFMIVGLDYAIVIAVLAATLSIIPYIGNIIGGLIALALSLTGDGGSSTQVIGIIVTISVAQTLESYILTPLIVGKEVSINPLTTIIAVVGFNILWGPVGAIVAIPIIAMFRIVCSHVDGLRDYAYLLGDD
ncbi:hypothetical protein CEQ90_05135 [Lewinellaceae bacterium SD302]|nr:hypothetical protein CEQ90_05135 [Lewinellaceae bacterium SD302]